VTDRVLRDGLLAGSAIVVAGGGELGSAVAARAGALGASVQELAVDPWGEEPAFDGAADVLVWDGAAAFAGAALGGAGAAQVEPVRAALDGAWLAIRPVARTAMIDAGGGRIVLLAPTPGGAAASAARAGLENLARTLSIEWARFQVRTVAILPGAATSPTEVAELVAFLASPAGEYYSGCAFELGTV
jgi:NAD(P)-dependent dehydrogenase (short-subunit alcohol dehydrogenase family)